MYKKNKKKIINLIPNKWYIKNLWVLYNKYLENILIQTIQPGQVSLIIRHKKLKIQREQALSLINHKKFKININQVVNKRIIISHL